MDTRVARLSISLDGNLLRELDRMLRERTARWRLPTWRGSADRLIALKGVKHGKLALTTTGRDLPA